MDQLQLIQAKKWESFAQAQKESIPITNNDGEELGFMVPIGPWALQDHELVRAFTKWRKTFMRFYMVQFNATEESMRYYLEHLSIAAKDRLFFAIYLPEGTLVGHIGLSHITAKKAELDNLIRGVSGGDPQLIYFAEKTLLHWTFQSLGVQWIEAQVQSKNTMASSLHERLGFKTENSYPLKKVVSESQTILQKCEPAEATESFQAQIMVLKKEDFSLLS